ncbi:MAG: hypothetical protein HKO65_06735 [Gemmatimonadetes bacterium]|nr:SRPBCC family protein [Gemmatimonadota bacterium]NNM04784.1 hypothetical protein [Gemmatimonadota bacterium]
MRYQHKVDIDSPVSRVFAFMDDVAREPEWQPGIKAAYKEPPGDTAVGTEKRYVSEFMGRRIENTYVTKVFDRDQKVVYETTPDSVLRAKVELTFTDTGSSTQVTMAVEGKAAGALKFIPKGILEAVFRKELEGSLTLLKKVLEA